jgi:hypothetical protein
VSISLIGHTNWHTQIPSPTVDTTASGGATLIVVILANLNGATSLVDSPGNTYVQRNTVTSGARTVTLFYKIAPTTSASHTWTFSGGNVNGAVALAFNPVSPVFDQESAGGTSAGTTVQPGSLTPGGASNFLIATLGGDGDTSFAIGSGFTIGDTSPYVGGSNFSASGAYLEQASATAQNPQWTVGSNVAAICASLLSFTFTGSGPAFIAKPSLLIKQAVNRAGTY